MDDDQLDEHEQTERTHLRNAVLRSAYFVERPLPKRWTNRMMTKLLASNITNKDRLLTFLNSGMLNELLRRSGQRTVHKITLKFLRVSMNDDTSSVQKILNRLSYFDLGNIGSLPASHYMLEQDRMAEGRRPTFGLTQHEVDGIGKGNSLIGSRYLFMVPEGNENYESSRYYLENWVNGEHASYGPDF